MKRWLSVLLIVIVLCIASIYIFIPSTLVVGDGFLLAGLRTPLTRGLHNETTWPVWWSAGIDSPSTPSPDPRQFLHNGNKYLIREKLYQGLAIQAKLSQVESLGKIDIIPQSSDTVAIRWQTSISTSNNPITRFNQYRDAVALKKDMGLILPRLKSFLANPDNIYQVKISRTLVQDTLVMAARWEMNHYPSTREIYSFITEIRNYVKQGGAKETNPPMLNITRIDSVNYSVMAAIPVDKMLPEKGKIGYRKLPRGFLLTTEVKGAQTNVDNAFKELENYISDFEKTAIAIPFQSLITERINEPDSSRWITAIYFPVVR